MHHVDVGTHLSSYRRIVGLVAALALLALLAGCTTPQYNYTPAAREISTPPLAAVSVANVGDEMLKQGKFTEREAMKLTRRIKIGILGTYTLLPGYYLKTGEDKNSDFYRPFGGPESGDVQKGALSDPWESIQLSKDGTKIFVVTIFHLKAGADADGVERTKYNLLTDDSFQQTLIYSGRVGGKIKVGYREFSNDRARPAFNNDVDYDLTESPIIGYKGARHEVIEATNERITYRVISNFNRATQ